MKKIKFSLIIPVAPWRDAEIVNSIKELDFPKNNYEIIIQKGKNPSDNRNIGVKKSKGEILVFLDDDAIISKDYLKKLSKFLKKYPKIDIIGGPQLTPKDDRFFAKISGIALMSNFGAFKVNKRYKKGELNFNAGETELTSANLCVKKKVFEKIDGFNINMYPGEDPEFIFRAKNFGFKVAYNPEMIIYHRRRPNLLSFFGQFFKYGLVRPKRNKILKDSKLFFMIPMFFSLYILFLCILIIINKIFLIPLEIYLILSLIFSAYDSIKHKNIIAFFILPFLYLVIHLSYGIGMIIGYIKR